MSGAKRGQKVDRSDDESFFKVKISDACFFSSLFLVTIILMSGSSYFIIITELKY